MAPPALPEVGMSSSNPITTEVIRNAFLSAAEQMNASLVRSAYSPIIYEAKDCSVALFDERGEALAVFRPPGWRCSWAIWGCASRSPPPSMAGKASKKGTCTS